MRRIVTSTYDREFWEQLWRRTLHEHAGGALRPPSAHLTHEVSSLSPGRALDAGCGHGSDTLWLAAHGWKVCAVDFSAAALAHGRDMAEAAGPEIADRVDWVEADLATWAPQPGHFDLVVSLYVHVAGSMQEMVSRLGAGVAPGGTLLAVGHRPIDPASGAPTPAAGQQQVSVQSAVAALDTDQWHVVVADDRPRPAAGSGVDAVIRARRLL
ncbi:MAG TPA: class I SAM-dependent methyltransferase [Gaiellaceae bacterium]